MRLRVLILSLFLFITATGWAQDKELRQCNIVWTKQSNNSGESMPCGGNTIGLNVWVENNELLFYASRSGSFDENNSMLKAGRFRIRFSPNPFGEGFRQELDLQTGKVTVEGTRNGQKLKAIIWVDVFSPTIFVQTQSNKPLEVEAIYESWRYADRPLKGRANNGNSYKWAPQGEVKTSKDSIGYDGNAVLFYHRNPEYTVFDVTAKQQGLDSLRGRMYNPLKSLISGGRMLGEGMVPGNTGSGVYLKTDYKSWSLKTVSPSRKQTIRIDLYSAQAEPGVWKKDLARLSLINASRSFVRSQAWWADFWKRSFIYVNSDQPNEADTAFQIGRNYQLFRYMLASNAFGEWPTKFNGGLFTYDPVLTDTAQAFTPDYMNWGGGIHTAQNQRLVYHPMVRAGDFDLLHAAFRFYLRLLPTAELRSKVYWNHAGACFTEQMENFGLPNAAEYTWRRPANFDPGVEYNAWLEYEWDTVFEFCLMMLQAHNTGGESITTYLPFIESCLRFFDEHYQYEAKKRGRMALDGAKKLVIYPGSAAETFKMAYNPVTTVAGMQKLSELLLQLPDTLLTVRRRAYIDSLQQRIPPLSFASFNGQKTIAPAKLWERINNTETPQLYPVFPWGIYGVGKPDLQTAINTYFLDTNAVKFRSAVGWKQDFVFAAGLGLREEAKRLALAKMKNSGRRFPAFWGPGFDWTPDHNWGGSGMIGMQEMLIAGEGEKIYLFPSWPKEWDVHFKLWAPGKTTVEATLKNGKLEKLEVIPASRKKDVINLLEQ